VLVAPLLPMVANSEEKPKLQAGLYMDSSGIFYISSIIPTTGKLYNLADDGKMGFRKGMYLNGQWNPNA